MCLLDCMYIVSVDVSSIFSWMDLVLIEISRFVKTEGVVTNCILGQDDNLLSWHLTFEWLNYSYTYIFNLNNFEYKLFFEDSVHC